MPESRRTAQRPDRSMALLADLARDAQDPAYAEAARRRRPVPDARARPAAGRRAGAVLGLTVLTLLGLAVGVAAGAVRTGSDSPARLRSELLPEVRARTAASDGLRGEVAGLRAEVAARRDDALLQDAQGRRDAAALAELELAAGTQRVTGPGVVVVLADRPPDTTDAPAQQRGGRPGDGRVTDRDLQQVVNGLWAAGAEAVSVNDQRLTARTAIRSAGEAVLVDFRPLTSPYTVRAVAGPDLQDAFTGGDTGRALATYAALAGLRFEVDPAGSLTLPAGSPPEPRSVRLPAVPGPGAPRPAAPGVPAPPVPAGPR